MQALDDIAFSHPAILDQRVQNEGDGLALHLVALQRVELPALRRAYAAALPPGLPFSLHVHLYNPQNERAQYSRKRRVLRDGEEP